MEKAKRDADAQQVLVDKLTAAGNLAEEAGGFADQQEKDAGKSPEDLYKEAQAKIAKDKKRAEANKNQANAMKNLKAAMEAKVKAQREAKKKKAEQDKFNNKKEGVQKAANAADSLVENIKAKLEDYGKKLKAETSELKKLNLERILKQLNKQLPKALAR